MIDHTLEFLTVLERQEARLLCWGYVDVGFTDAEVERSADDYLQRTGAEVDRDELIHDLQQRGLLLEVDRAGDVVLRTRMAETVRLAARLRQLFSNHTSGPGWRSAATLVSDYRFALRPRLYPRRDLAVPQVIQDLRKANVEPALLDATETLLRGRGDGFTLSKFQVDSTLAILQGLRAAQDRGTVICAGTGAGKTLAFYLPALAHLARHRTGTRVLAIYPRIELLRDQFAAAYAETEALVANGRTVRLGALYGSTPYTAASAARVWAHHRSKDGFVCPFLPCPSCTGGDLLWLDADREARREVLICDRCAQKTPEGRIALSRSALRQHPADLLFATTEMLNRAMADGAMRPLIGLGPNAQPIDLLLLDEIHTYEGSAGAHVGLLLRRWRHARRGRPVHVVGLSATLRDAAGFLSALAGIPGPMVTAVQPRAEDLVAEGHEYLLALRSDPTSGAGVLSTSIQTAMLLQRVLDPLGHDVSGGAFGQRLFAFTDDLEIVNRFYFDLLDAEGLSTYGGPRRPPLASIRMPDDDLTARRADGQSWEALRSLGHQLGPNDHLRISRTTSQDGGVDAAATAIVATSSLEVGFDDDRVGAVLQHKSPRGSASFLQRKGRAGRKRGMRPWTVITLSDAGRDRVAYQRYEELFDPELAARALPVKSPVVVRMQAVYVLTDWLTERLRQRASTWAVLQRPTQPRDPPALVEHRADVLEFLRRILANKALQDELRLRLQRVLEIDTETAESVLWDAPRPLLTSVIPTAVRRLEREWKTLEPPGLEHAGAGPLPEFVVSRLFGDLHLPEVAVTSPPPIPGRDEERTEMALVLALSSYAPGRVSFRLTVSNRFARHWVAPPEDLEDRGESNLAIEAFCDGYVELEPVVSTAGPLRVVCPTSLRLAQPPEPIRSSSHGRWRWERSMEPTLPGTPLDGISGGPLDDLVQYASWHLHAGRREVRVRRWAHAVDVDLKSETGDVRGRVRLVDAAGAPTAIGFDTTVDGLRLVVQPPADLHAVPETDRRALRIEHLRDLVTESHALSEHLGDFNREKLARALVVALVDRANKDGSSLDSAFADHPDAVIDSVQRLMASGSDFSGLDSRGQSAIGQALAEPVVREALGSAVEILWANFDEAWLPWLRRRWCATVGGLVHRALQDMCPEYDLDDVLLEVEQHEHGRSTLWLLETTIGGSGLLQAAAQRVVDDPRAFGDLVFAGMLPGSAELVAVQLETLTERLADDDELQEALQAVREASDHNHRAAAFARLRQALAAVGIFPSHAVVAAITARFLRPGASPASDEVTRNLVRRWRRLEENLGIELDLTTFARLQASNDSLDRLTGGAIPHDRRGMWRASQAQGLLWPRGAAARRTALTLPNRFTALPDMDPRIVAAHVDTRTRSVGLADADLLRDPSGPLAQDGDAALLVDATQVHEARAELLKLLTEPIETGAMLDHARIRAVRRTARGLEVRLALDLASA